MWVIAEVSGSNDHLVHFAHGAIGRLDALATFERSRILGYAGLLELEPTPGYLSHERVRGIWRVFHGVGVWRQQVELRVVHPQRNRVRRRTADILHRNESLGAKEPAVFHDDVCQPSRSSLDDEARHVASSTVRGLDVRTNADVHGWSPIVCLSV